MSPKAMCDPGLEEKLGIFSGQLLKFHRDRILDNSII